MPSEKQFSLLIKNSFAIFLEFTLISHPLYPILSNTFSHTGHFLSVLELYFLSSLSTLLLPRAITICLLPPPPPPATNTYSSSYRSQSKCTSLEAFHDYPSSKLS